MANIVFMGVWSSIPTVQIRVDNFFYTLCSGVSGHSSRTKEILHPLYNIKVK